VGVSTGFDPGREAAAAKAPTDRGADILMQHPDSPAAMKFAEEKGVLAFGQASDMVQFGPNAQLTAIVDDWKPYYIKRVRALLQGTWTTGDVWDGIAQGTVALSPWSKKIPADVVALAEAARANIERGGCIRLPGPKKKRAGAVGLRGGGRARTKTLRTITFSAGALAGPRQK